MEVMEKLAKRNISIPDDLSVVSFDNRLPFLSPPLTTFAPDNDEFCKEIFDLMISSMDKAQKTSITLKYVPVKLLERSSCRKV
jgi:DNA-binding LacI/PurR family transcriptional regulator